MARETLPPALVAEADLMVTALVADLWEVPDTDVVYTRDPRLAGLGLPGECRWDDPERVPWDSDGAERLDAIWPIAPETGRILERISASIRHAGKILLGSRPEAIAVCASKMMTAARLAEHGLPVVPTYPVRKRRHVEAGPWVLKPDDGVGCDGVVLCADHDALLGAWKALGSPAGYVAQPHVHGEAASLSLLCHAGATQLLSVNRQRITIGDDQRFLLNGCDVNALSAHRPMVAELARGLGTALPGLWGYVGVDCLLADSEVTLLEVNPRLTTSYAGLKQALGVNPAELVLRLVTQTIHGVAPGELIVGDGYAR